MEIIDFVITYLDGNDLEWQKERNSYHPGEKADINPNRYRYWNNLQYLFRGIELYAPWVRKVHLVTCGHIPEWLNIKYPKLNVVRHDEYIPKEWLPTFSSRCIDMNLHRIPGIADHFVYFNDDMFLTKPVREEDFFIDGLPCDTPIICASAYKLKNNIGDIHLAPVIDIAILNKYFSKRKIIKKDWGKWYNYKYGIYNFITLLMFPYSNFTSFMDFHIPYAYNKKIYEEVWEKEYEICASTCQHKFRETSDPNHWIFTYWQYATGQFSPRTYKVGKCFQLHTFTDAKIASEMIRKQKYKMVCLNDSILSDEDYELIKAEVNDALNKLMSKKSKFEK